ncbi:hypothetical protein AMC79_CH02872 [Rhizobium phaseoli]|nr:hypothetical protein AMC79_CH02872 [Rhizobium phaseoli]
MLNHSHDSDCGKFQPSYAPDPQQGYQLMKLIAGWRRMLLRVWSIRLLLLAGALSGLEFALPYLVTPHLTTATTVTED